MINESTEDILNPVYPSVILHQVNCLGFGSLGLMARIAKEYPALFNEYHKLCGWFKDYKLQDEMLGSIQGLKIPNSKNILCNAFSQKFYSDTKYEAMPDMWEKCLRKVISQIKANYKATGIMYEIHCPDKIGIGMKPEEIDSLKAVVNELFSDNDINFVYHI